MATGSISTVMTSQATPEDEVRGGFSKREPNQRVMAESCDLVGHQALSDTHLQLKMLVEAFGKLIQEVPRVKEKEEKLSRRKVVDDSTLLSLACELGSEWERLATFLGFGVNNVYKFKNDNPHDTNNQIFQMLVKWRDEQYLTELVDCLGRELTKVNKGEMAKTLRDIDDSALREVSNQLGPNWETLATALGCDTDKVKNEFPYDTREHCFQMLAEWREKQLSPRFQIDKLCKELKRVDRKELADKLRELISDRDSKKPGLLEKPQIREQASGDHASAIGGSQPCMKTNYSQEELISDQDSKQPQILENCATARAIGGDQPCPQHNYSLKAPDILVSTREGKAQPHSHQQMLAVNRRE